MSANAIYDNPFKVLGERYLSLHLSHTNQVRRICLRKKMSNSLSWAQRIGDVPAEMKSFCGRMESCKTVLTII